MQGLLKAMVIKSHKIKSEFNYHSKAVLKSQLSIFWCVHKVIILHNCLEFPNIAIHLLRNQLEFSIFPLKTKDLQENIVKVYI